MLLRLLHFEVSVDGDRVVQGGGYRHAVFLHLSDAVPETLVVVHQVVLVTMLLEVSASPQTKGPRLGKTTGAHVCELEQVNVEMLAPAQFVRARDVPRIIGTEQIERR